MLKNLFIITLLTFLLFSCSKKNKEESIKNEPSDLEMAESIYLEAVESLKEGEQVGTPNKPISKKKKRRRRR